jgi:hypothetical protein
MCAPKVMTCLSRIGVGVLWLELVRVSMWFFVLASVCAALLFGSLLGLGVSVGIVCCY